MGSKIAELDRLRAAEFEAARETGTKVDDLGAMVELLTSQLDEFRLIRTQQEQGNLDLSCLVDQLKASEVEHLTELASKGAEISRLQQLNVGLTTDVERLRSESADLERAAEKERAEVARLEKLRAEHCGEMERLGEVLSCAQGRTLDLESRVAEAEDQVRQERASSQSLSSELESMSTSRAELQACLDTERAKVVELEHARSSLASEVDRFSKETQLQKSRLTELENVNADLSFQLQTSSTAHAESSSGLESANSKLAEMELVNWRLEEDLQRMRDTEAELVSVQQAQKSSMADLSQRNGDLLAQIEQMRLTAAGDEQKRLEELDGLRSELAATVEKLNSSELAGVSADEVHRSETNSLNDRIRELGAESEKLKQMLEERARVGEDAQSRNATLAEENEHLLQQLDAFKLAAESDRAKMTELENSKMELEEKHRLEVAELCREKDSLSAEIVQNKVTDGELRDLFDLERSRVVELQQQNTGLCRSLEEARRASADDRSRVEDLQEAVKELEKVQAARVAEVERLTMLSQEWLESLEKERQNTARSEELGGELSVRLSAAESELEKFRHETERLTQELCGSRSAEGSTSAALETERCRANELVEETRKLQQMFEEQAKVVDDARARNAELSAANEQLSQQSDAFKSLVEAERIRGADLEKSKMLELEQRHLSEVSELRRERDRLSEEIARIGAASGELRDAVELERARVGELQEQNSDLCRSLEEARSGAAAVRSRVEQLQEAATELEKVESSRVAEIERLKTLNQEQLENLEKEKQNVTRTEQANSELSDRLSAAESKLEKVRTEGESLAEKLQQSRSAEDGTSAALEVEKSRVAELQQEIERLLVQADTSDAVSKVRLIHICFFANKFNN